jgi:ATP-dependent Lon protease
MTGEITLRGKILPIGGVREKVMAARRAQLTNVILPAFNEKDMVDIPKGARRGLNSHFVDNMREVIDLILLEPPSERQRDINNPADEDDEDDHKADKA